MAKVLHPFRGSLSIQQVADGMNCATANASRLAKDARLLLSNGRWPTAASVAALSIEEAGKVVILRRLLTAEDGQVAGLWREYRLHTKKNVNWIFPDLVRDGARCLDDFRRMVDGSSDHPELLDALKQLGFYTDCLGNAHWSVPVEVVDEALATKLVRHAEILAPDRTITVRELELWVKHMKPFADGRDYERAKIALVDWYAEMQTEGLAPRGGTNPMAEFVERGLTLGQAEKLMPSEAE